MKTITIKRPKWLRADEESPSPVSKLLDYDGNMCCLGFAIHQVTGCELSKLIELITPKNYFNEESFLTSFDFNGILRNNTFAERAMYLNDMYFNPGSKNREKKLKELFLEYGFTLNFVD